MGSVINAVIIQQDKILVAITTLYSYSIPFTNHDKDNLNLAMVQVQFEWR